MIPLLNLQLRGDAARIAFIGAEVKISLITAIHRAVFEYREALAVRLRRRFELNMIYAGFHFWFWVTNYKVSLPNSIKWELIR